MTTKQLTVVTEFTDEERNLLWDQGVNMDDYDMAFLYEPDAEYCSEIDLITMAVARNASGTSYTKVTLGGKEYNLEMIYHS